MPINPAQRIDQNPSRNHTALRVQHLPANLAHGSTHVTQRINAALLILAHFLIAQAYQLRRQTGDSRVKIRQRRTGRRRNRNLSNRHKPAFNVTTVWFFSPARLIEKYPCDEFDATACAVPFGQLMTESISPHRIAPPFPRIRPIIANRRSANCALRRSA
jgi:hypothetical protein